MRRGGVRLRLRLEGRGWDGMGRGRCIYDDKKERVG